MVNVRAFVALGLSVVAIIFLFLGLFSNGWATGEADFFGAKIEVGYGLREMEMSAMGESMSESLSTLADQEKEANKAMEDEEDYEEMTFAQDMNTAGLIGYIILWVALLACIAAVVFAILSGIGKMSGALGVTFGFIGGVLLLGAGIIWVILKPELESPLGLGWAFYLVIIGGVMQCVGGGLMIGIKKDGGGAPAPPPGGPAPGMPGEPPAPAPGSYEALYGSPAPAGHDQVQAPPPQQQQPGYGAPPRRPDEF